MALNSSFGFNPLFLDSEVGVPVVWLSLVLILPHPMLEHKAHRGEANSPLLQCHLLGPTFVYPGQGDYSALLQLATW